MSIHGAVYEPTIFHWGGPLCTVMQKPRGYFRHFGESKKIISETLKQIQVYDSKTYNLGLCWRLSKRNGEMRDFIWRGKRNTEIAIDFHEIHRSYTAHQTIEKNNRHGTSCNRLIAIPNRTVFEYQSICLLLCLHIGYQALAELLSCYLKSSFMVHRNGCYRQQTMSRLAEETQKWTQRTYCKKSFFYPRTTQVTSDWVWGDFLQRVPALLLSNPAPCFL